MPSDRKEFPPDIPPDKTVQDFLDEFEDRYGMISEEFFNNGSAEKQRIYLKSTSGPGITRQSNY